MNKEKIKRKYQKNHPNCEYCIWYKFHSPSLKVFGLNCPDYSTCELKDKIIKCPKIKAKFCKYYYIGGNIK